MAESSQRTKLLAGAGMVCVSTSVGVLYKASQAATGGFKYSTMSAICIAEIVKCAMSMGFHILDSSHQRVGASRLVTAFTSAKDQLCVRSVIQIYVLALLYMVNNQLSFFVYMLVDPGTVFLFKAASTMITAIVQCAFAGKTFSLDQWKAMMLQACGMIIVQYDPCKGGAVYSPLAYGCLCISTVITAISAARNEYLVKSYTVALNVQNAVLYSGGVFLNLAAFHFVPNPNSNADVGFFDGYDNALAIGVVASNALIGLVITAVYKYADAVVKCIASDITAVLLIIISAVFFHLRTTLTTFCGVFVVVFAVHLYIDASKAASASTPAKETATAAGSKAPPGTEMIGKAKQNGHDHQGATAKDNDASCSGEESESQQETSSLVKR
eukprot:TRINITY_DN8017_c0_g1_i1.p1 TRINITY_DN8017_c0_g1~~TRINITY_DN8017_c0_g1_i1.p1  ORF type:complete len:412 (-),score=73.37 TRINITY_DN8017_c0_g1_i1:55-1206(-)